MRKLAEAAGQHHFRNKMKLSRMSLLVGLAASLLGSTQASSTYHNGFQLYSINEIANQTSPAPAATSQTNLATPDGPGSCSNGLLTFELSTGFIYKPSSPETLAMMPGTLQLTDCLDYCLQNASCLAINFEMGLCVLLASSAKQNLNNLYSSQFPVFTIYAEKKCLLAGDLQANKQRRRCQRAWTFERVAGYEMKTRPRKRLKLSSKEACMEACLVEREFECRSANWYRQTGECSLSDQDRHSVSQSEAGDQQVRSSLHALYGPSNLTLGGPPPSKQSGLARPTLPPSLYQNYYLNMEALLNAAAQMNGTNEIPTNNRKQTLEQQQYQPPAAGETRRVARESGPDQRRKFRQLFAEIHSKASAAAAAAARTTGSAPRAHEGASAEGWQAAGGMHYDAGDNLLPANALVDYLENNCVYEPNKLCEFRKIQNRVLKTVDSIYQDVGSLEECKHKCLNAPYRCYSFDYGDTSERVCRTSHLDQASLLNVKEPYLDVVGAITYELASCFNVTIQCKAREMVATVISSKNFKGKIYVKSRPSSCVNDVRDSLKFELAMRYNDDACDVQANSNSQQGVFSNDIVIQHHDRIVTTQDVGLSVYCQYDLGNRSITNNVDLAIEKLEEPPKIESKTKPGAQEQTSGAGGLAGSFNSPLTITSLATTVVRSPNVTMRITNMNGQPVASATVGDRLALLFEINEKTSPFGIFVREIIAMDGKQMMQSAKNKPNNNGQNNNKGYHYANSAGSGGNGTGEQPDSNLESLFQTNRANSVQFIDADGCPTDANIMGPLVKMDPAGQRILAPFDAFKFPTSDMVFFRAVVSSCVSECKPVLCPGGVSSAPAGLMNTDTTGLTELIAATTPAEGKQATSPRSSTTSKPLGELDSTPSSMQSTISHLTSPYAQLTSTLTRWANNTPSDAFLNELLLNRTRTSTTPLPAHPFNGNDQKTSGGDLLTTIAGFGSTLEPAQTTLRPPLPDENEISQQLGANMTTNNHQLGRAPARPALSPSVISRPLINLDSLTPLQKQQLVRLFESKLKQQLGQEANGPLEVATAANNGSLSEMADLYTGFLTSVLLKGEQQKRRQQPIQTSLDDNYKRQPERLSQESLSGEAGPPEMQNQPSADLESFLSFLLRDANANKTADERKMEIITRLLEQQQSSSPDVSANLISRPDVGAEPQQFNYNNRRRSAEVALVQNRTAAFNLNQNAKLVAGPTPTQAKANQMTPEQRKRLKQQAFADSYLGAFHSFGKRRRKREDKPEGSLSSGYVYSEQSQQNSQFSSGVVEMYHMNGKLPPTRQKRQAAGPTYEMDELIIQSIKILDRPQAREEHNRKSSSLPRSRLVTGSQQQQQQQGLKARHSIEQPELTSLDYEDQQRLILEDDETSNNFRFVSWTNSTGALGVVALALSFIFVQLILVVVYFLDLNRRRAIKQRLVNTSNRLMQFKQDQLYASSILQSDCSSLASSTLGEPVDTFDNHGRQQQRRQMAAGQTPIGIFRTKALGASRAKARGAETKLYANIVQSALYTFVQLGF